MHLIPSRAVIALFHLHRLSKNILALTTFALQFVSFIDIGHVLVLLVVSHIIRAITQAFICTALITKVVATYTAMFCQ